MRALIRWLLKVGLKTTFYFLQDKIWTSTQYSRLSSDQLYSYIDCLFLILSRLIVIFHFLGQLELFFASLWMNGHYVIIVYTLFIGQTIIMKRPRKWLADSANQSKQGLRVSLIWGVVISLTKAFNEEIICGIKYLFCTDRYSQELIQYPVCTVVHHLHRPHLYPNN